MLDVDSPERISLPSPNVNEVYEVQCIAAVSDRIWVAGPSIFFLDAELPAYREVSLEYSVVLVLLLVLVCCLVAVRTEECYCLMHLHSPHSEDQHQLNCQATRYGSQICHLMHKPH